MERAIFLFLLSCLILIGCDDDSNPSRPTRPQKTSIVGNWIPDMFYEKGYDKDGLLVSDTFYSYSDFSIEYDMEMIMKITPDSMIMHMRIEDEYGKEGYGYTLSGNNITGEIIDALEYEEDLEIISFQALIKDGQLLMNTTTEYFFPKEDIKTFVSTEYYNPYTGQIPPADWPPLSTVEDDAYEPDNSYSSATSIASDGTSQDHTLTEDDEDWFSFSAVSGTSYIIKTTGITDTYLCLYDKDAFTLLKEDDDDDEGTGLGEDWNAVILWECTAGGTYYFKVTGFDGYETGYYSISVSISTLTKQNASPLNKSRPAKKVYKRFIKLLKKRM